MMRFRNTVLIVTSLLTIWTTGCAKVSSTFEYIRTPRPMTTQQVDVLKARLGNIGVVGADFMPEVMLQLPEKQGKRSSSAGSAAMQDCRDLASCLISAALGLAIDISVAAIAGDKTVAATAEDAEGESANQAKVDQALLALRLQEQMRDRLSSRLADLKTFPSKPLQEAGPDKDGHAPDYSPLKSKGIDTVSEISVQSLVFAGRKRAKPDLAVTLNVRVRLISTSDNRKLLAKDYDCSGEEYPLKVLAGNEAQKFREEMDRCYAEIAENAVTDLFVNDTLLRNRL